MSNEFGTIDIDHFRALYVLPQVTEKDRTTYTQFLTCVQILILRNYGLECGLDLIAGYYVKLKNDGLVSYITPSRVNSYKVSERGRHELMRIHEFWQEGREPWNSYYLPVKTPRTISPQLLT